MEALKKPILITKKDLDAMLEQIWPGGTTIIENSASLGAEFTLHAFMEYSKRRRMPIVIEDIFDTLPVYLAHLEFLGVNPEGFNIRVLKVGGSQEAGNVLAKINFENDPHVYQKKIDQELKKIVPDGPYIHFVLGLDRLLFLQDDVHNMYTHLALIKQKLGDERRINVYLIEKSIVERIPYNPLPLMEDIATSVIELTDEGEGVIRIRLRKSIFTLLMNKEYLLISPREVLRWWE
ncbi:hypothetical protein FH039_02765 [Thermococcus indicus]|uniref:KaiC-like domain-containing protein n=1 Tax=Thermococcus indicus TaxID=2586643 RepID=A0A4Y5SIT9_9EURY|nr:DUF257 family protein [Thermococcus indicus]QDA30746.1 hypothetical protein FH039_02765 [Thermococcus indicus]